MSEREVRSTPRSRQLLLRLTEHEYDVLEAAGHLQRMTPNAYAYALIKSHVLAIQQDQFVVRDLENRRAFEAAAADSKTIPFKRGDGLDQNSPAASRRDASSETE